MSRPIVIVGAGLAGWTVVRELRRLDSTTPVVVVSADSGDFYPKPSLSNALAMRRAPGELVTMPGQVMAQNNSVRLLARTRALALDPVARTLDIQYGGHVVDRLEWRALVLATGARPVRPPLGGNAADTVLSVNHLDDYTVFRQRLSEGARVLVMGGGLIGCEFANDLAIAGHAVTVVEPADRPLGALLPQPLSQALAQALEHAGGSHGSAVNWRLGRTVSAVDRAGNGLRATLSDGRVVDCDLVLSAIGLRPDIALAQAAGLACERGVQVDSRLRTSAKGIFALGDCAQYASASGLVLPYVMPIMNAARTLAAVLAGQAAQLRFPVMPVAIKTPALPVVVAPPLPALGPAGQQAAGQWQADGALVWRYTDGGGRMLGFALAGAQTARRADMLRQMSTGGQPPTTLSTSSP